MQDLVRRCTTPALIGHEITIQIRILFSLERLATTPLTAAVFRTSLGLRISDLSAILFPERLPLRLTGQQNAVSHSWRHRSPQNSISMILDRRRHFAGRYRS